MEHPKRLHLKSRLGVNLKGTWIRSSFPKGSAHYAKHGKRDIMEILTKVEPKEVLEKVICEPNEADFLGFEVEELVKERKGALFKDDLNHEFKLKYVSFFETQ